MLSVPSSYVYDRPTYQSSVWETGPLVDGTAGNSLFLFLLHAQRNVASKRYFGKVSGLHVMLYVHTAQNLSVRPPQFINTVGHTECLLWRWSPFYWGHPWLLRTQTANSRSEVTPHSDTLPLTQDETVVEDFITPRWKCGIHFGPDVSKLCTVYSNTYWPNFSPKRHKVSDVAVSSNRHLSRR